MFSDYSQSLYLRGVLELIWRVSGAAPQGMKILRNQFKSDPRHQSFQGGLALDATDEININHDFL